MYRKISLNFHIKIKPYFQQDFILSSIPNCLPFKRKKPFTFIGFYIGDKLNDMGIDVLCFVTQKVVFILYVTKH